MITNLRQYAPKDEPNAGSGAGKDYPNRELEKQAAQRTASHPGDAEHAAGMDNDDKGDGYKGSNTPLVNIDRGEREGSSDDNGRER